ncbi:MAG TPA: tetratricopeptide repeat protein [Gammaproteobacteria bacterium]
MARVSVAGVLLLAACGAFAQDVRERQDPQETRAAEPVPAVSQPVYERLAEARACAQKDDMQCALRALERVRAIGDLTDYELAQMWRLYALVYLRQGSHAEAIAAYENALEPSAQPLGLRAATMLALAELYARQERYQDALDTLGEWFLIAENPNPEAYVLKAQIHHRLEQYEQAVEPLVTGIEIARARGREAEEGWYQLLAALYFELENDPKVIETLTVLVERWPKKEYLVQLAAMYGRTGEETLQLALYEAAYEAGWLTSEQEIVNLARMLLQADIPYKAALLLQQGLDDGAIESTESNWQLLSEAWRLARQDEKALPALTRATQLAQDGELHFMLAQSYANLARWEECAEAARDGLERGGLERPDQANLLLGNCLTELEQYDAARSAFEAAARDERSRERAEQWLDYIENEQDRERQLEQAVRRRAVQRRG